MKLGEYTIADSLLNKITTGYPDEVTADYALFLQAGVREHEMKDPVKAMELYARLLSRYPSSIYVIDARKRFRFLRGDKLE
jgi:outer membrane protein assembly factor BamD (BamD/ComL family)